MSDKKRVVLLTNEIEQLETKSKLLSLEQEALRESLNKLRTQLKIENQEVKVSDHAIVRYLERKLELNLDDIRKEILSDKLLTLVDTLGKSGKFTVGGMTMVMKNGVVVTIY